MESIEIKNFGPIKHVKLDLKDINVFIGTTGSGKSTVAKLVAIFRDVSFSTKSTFELFVKYATKYNIDFEITDETYVKYNNNEFYWELKHKAMGYNEANWLLARLMAIIDKLTSILYSFKNPDDFTSHTPEKVRKALLGMSLLNSLDDFIALESEKGNKELPKQAQILSSVIEEYKARKEQLDMNNVSSKDVIAVIDNLINDPRLSELLPLTNTNIFPNQTTYVPAERNLLSMVGQSIFGLMSNNVSIAAAIKEFGSAFESARKQLKKLSIFFLNAEYRYTDNSNIVVLIRWHRDQT